MIIAYIKQDKRSGKNNQIVQNYSLVLLIFVL